MCDCHSYNKDNGQKPEAILTPPIEFGFTKTSICVDACIAKVVQHLWDNEVVTMNSCCGHGKQAPSLILKDDCDRAEADRVRAIIDQVDQRRFELLSWRLVIV